MPYHYPPGTDIRSRSVEVSITCGDCGHEFGAPGFEGLGITVAEHPDAPCPECGSRGGGPEPLLRGILKRKARAREERDNAKGEKDSEHKQHERMAEGNIHRQS